MKNAESRKTIAERIVERIAALIVEHPRRALLAGFLLFMVLAPGVGRVYQNIKYYIWFPPGDQKIELLDQFEQRFGSDLASVLVVHSPSGIFDKDSAQLLIELTQRMWKVSETIRVESLANFPWVHAEGDDLIVEDLIPHDKELTPQLLAQRREVALHHEQLPGFLVSRDGKTTVLYGWLQPTKTGPGKNAYNDFVRNSNDLRKLIEEFKGRGDHQFYLSGFPVMEGYLEVYPPQEMQHLMPMILIMCMVLLFVFLRRPAGVLLPFTVVIPSVIATLGLAGWANFPINPMTITSPNLVIIIGVSSTVQVLSAYFRALNGGMVRKEAARHALERELIPTFLSCLTIAIGFLSLLTMTIPPMQQLGALVAGGTFMVLMLICLVLGPAMVLLPLKPKRGARVPAGDADLEAPGPRAIRLTAWIDRFKVPIVIGWLALLGLSIELATHNKIVFDPIEWYDESTDVRKSLDFIREHMGSSESFEIVIDSGAAEGIKDPAFLAKVDQLSAWLRSKKTVVQVFSLVDVFKETNRALFGGDPAQYRLPDSRRGVADQYLLYTLNLPMGKSVNDRVTMSNDALRMTVVSRLENSPAVMRMSEEIRVKAKELGLTIELTGRPLLYHQLNTYVVPSFFSSMASGTIVIALILLIYFRSVQLALLGLLLELIPLAIGAGIVFFLMGKRFDMATVSVFSIVLGVTVDDTVHFLHGYGRNRREGYSPVDSICRLWPTVGAGMLSSQMILAGCFGLFLLITFPVLRDLGVLVFWMLIIAFIANVTLSPAILLLFRRKDGADPADRES
ncbi:MAG TPA: MMPL family transporter [Kofleriaceae bacterium]|nr:MMPL family transporter [Kofleriaceae bacterium]